MTLLYATVLKGLISTFQYYLIMTGFCMYLQIKMNCKEDVNASGPAGF